MAVAIVLGVLAVICVVIYLARISSKPESYTPEPPPTEAELVQARLDLLQVELGFSASLARLEHHQAAEQVKQSIADAFEDRR